MESGAELLAECLSPLLIAGLTLTRPVFGHASFLVSLNHLQHFRGHPVRWLRKIRIYYERVAAGILAYRTLAPFSTNRARTLRESHITMRTMGHYRVIIIALSEICIAFNESKLKGLPRQTRKSPVATPRSGSPTRASSYVRLLARLHLDMSLFHGKMYHPRRLPAVFIMPR